MGNSLLTIFFAFIVGITSVSAQIRVPQPSPLCNLSQTVGLVKIDVEYSRPSARGRKIFGGLVPFGEMWRTGANAATKITFADEVKVNYVNLPKGSYALYTIPGEKEWTIIFYKNTSFWGVPDAKSFKEEDVAARFNVPVKTVAEKVETFTINISNLTNSSADLELVWENTKVVIPIQVDTDSKVMADIKATMAGPKASDYYAAARYYYEENKDMEQALEWVNKNIEMAGEKFWVLRLKANILAKLGRYQEAIAVANRSTELAKADGNTEYPRLNEESIAEWKKKL
ncbi:MAG: DUF2911 domain-containing protein [Saprospiraceae bacterium]|nr:DUF2911 domain-containing protein [Saprospiraceae bacterium]MDW8485206.1 DUF2911 domain-containing protein [Saprospiraceae bacterium]